MKRFQFSFTAFAKAEHSNVQTQSNVSRNLHSHITPVLSFAFNLQNGVSVPVVSDNCARGISPLVNCDCSGPVKLPAPAL